LACGRTTAGNWITEPLKCCGCGRSSRCRPVRIPRMSPPRWGCTARRCTGGWRSSGRAGGTLVAKPVPGRPPKLTGAQIARLYEWVVGSDPAQFSFEFALWTREMVRQVIRREFQVALSVVSVGRLLRTMGLSPQRPLYRAYQQNPEAVQRWKDEQFPAIRKAAKAEGPRSTSPTRPGSARTTTPAPPGHR
jgi:transposase